MLCAISGEAPEAPVASRKSGHVFEKRLIEAYISEHGTDPINGEELSTTDLIDLQSARVVKPRPPTLTSIPTLLSTFQNEWDAMTLQTFKLSQQLTQREQELSTALYQYDAAVRIIVRLQHERDEARDALSKLTASDAAGAGGDAMDVDAGAALPEDVAAKVDAMQSRLSSTRLKRAVPSGWATADVVEAFDTVDETDAVYAGAKALAVTDDGSRAVIGGADAVSVVYSLEDKKAIRSLKTGSGAVTAAISWDDRIAIGSSTGAVSIISDGSEPVRIGSHAGPASTIALHPTKEILASAGADKAIKFYDLNGMKMVTQIITESGITCGEFHPDGHLFAAGCVDGKIRIYEVKTGDEAAVWDADGPLQALSFSENGTWLASVGQGQTGASIWDIRKSKVIKVLYVGSAVTSAQWDYTGQFLALAGLGGVAVVQYSKASKKWTEPFKKAVAAERVAWGADARSLAVLTEDGRLVVLGTAAA